MNVLESLEKSIVLWTYIQVHNVEKVTAYNELQFRYDDCHCPLCEYTTQLNVTCTAGCPVWRGQDKLCMHNDSVYHKWEYAKQAYKQPYAEQMLQKLKDTLISYEL